MSLDLNGRHRRPQNPGPPDAARAAPVLPDVLAPGLSVVFCGSAPGSVSAASGAYYAHPQNRFWRALHEAGFTPRRLAPREYALAPLFGLGLTDIAKTASGMDRELPPDALGAGPCASLAGKVAAFAPRALAFTSLHAGRRFLRRADARVGPQTARLGETQLWILPSPSPTATWCWDLAPWRELAEASRV